MCWNDAPRGNMVDGLACQCLSTGGHVARVGGLETEAILWLVLFVTGAAAYAAHQVWGGDRLGIC